MKINTFSRAVDEAEQRIILKQREREDATGHPSGFIVSDSSRSAWPWLYSFLRRAPTDSEKPAFLYAAFLVPLVIFLCNTCPIRIYLKFICICGILSYHKNGAV